MSGTSPAVTLFNSEGTELAVKSGDTISLNSPALILAGKTTDGYAYPVSVDGYGRQVIVSDPSSPLAISGNITATNPSVGTNDATAPTSSTQIAGVNIDGYLTAVQVSREGHVAIAGNTLQGYAGEVVGWTTTTHQSLTVDGIGALYTRGQVMTDEGSFTDDFQGSGFTTNLTGTLEFTNGSDQVVGTGTLFLTELDYYTVIKKSTDADTLFIQVSSVEDDTHLTLLTPYQGTSQSGQTGVKSKWITAVGTGGSISVGSSLVTIAAGTTSGSITGFWTVPDYIPFLGALKVSVDNRRSNQNIYIGWFDVAQNAQPNLLAAFLLDGTTNTAAKCVSGTSTAAADTQTTSITIPNGANSTASNIYRVAPWQGQVAFYINDSLVAVNTQHIVPPYADIRFGVYVVNTGIPAGATSIVTDSAIYESIDRFDVRCYNTNADLLQVTANGRTTTGVPVPLQVSSAGIAVVSGAVTLSGTANTIRGNVTQYTADGTAAAANSLPVIAQMLAKKEGANTLDRLVAGPTNADGEAVETVGALVTKSRLYGFNGTTWDRLDSSTANGLIVDVSRVQGTVTVGGINANGGGITGNPVRIGGSSGAATYDIKCDTSGNLYMQGMGTAGAASGGVLTIQGDPSGTPIPISGSITATNPSVSIVNTTPPGSATYIGAKANTNAPTMTDGYIAPLSLTTGGRLRVESQFLNVVDSGNSTTTPLGAGATFTGTAVDLLSYASITYSVFTDQDSAANGVVCQFSPDNVNWDDRITNSKTADGTVSDFSARPHDRYFRIKYTNGATPQTTFRFYTILKRIMPAGDTTGVDHPPHSGDDALLVKAVMSGKSTGGGGSYVDVKVNPSGTIQIGGGDTPAEGHANPTDAQLSTAFNMGWNGTTWDRIQTHGNDVDADTVESTGSLAVCSHNMVFNGTTWDRIRGTIANGQLVDVSRVQGNVTVTQATASNLNAAVVGTGVAGTPAGGVLTVQGSPTGTPIPISGSITATNPSVGSIGASVPTSGTFIAGTDGSLLRGIQSVQVQTAPNGSDYALVTKNAYQSTIGASVPSYAAFMSGTDGSLARAVYLATAGTAVSGSEYAVLVRNGFQAQTGQSPPSYAALIGGSDGSLTRVLRTAADGTLRVDPTGTTTQPVSGTVTAAQATAANLNATVVQGNAGTAAQGWFARITDGTNTAAVKGASTAAIATDPALVVAISPNNSLTISGNITPADAFANPTTAQTGWSLQAVFNGTTWDRARGTAALGTYVSGPVASGNTVPANPVFVGGSDGTNVRAIRTDTSGYAAVRVTDQTNFMPTMDAAARRGYVQITDGTNSMPTADTVARSSFHRITDGTNTAAVKAASTAAIATDPALVVAISPNNPLTIGGSSTPSDGYANPSTASQSQAFNMVYNGTTWDRQRGTTALGTYVSGPVASGNAVPANPIFIGGSDGTNIRAVKTDGYGDVFTRLSDGVSNVAIKAASTAAVATDPALVVAISPNNSLTVKEPRPGTASQANVALSATSVTLLSSNSNRLRYSVINDTNRQAYVSHSGAASTTNFKYTLQPGEYYEDPFPCFTGAVTIIWSASGSGSARVCEET
jgi:hypothetical protein